MASQGARIFGLWYLFTLLQRNISLGIVYEWVDCNNGFSFNTQPAAARGRYGDGWAVAHPCGRRLWQDARYHLSHRISHRGAQCCSVQYSRSHFYEQGCGRDARARQAIVERHAVDERALNLYL